jgi:hypothetical protein
MHLEHDGRFVKPYVRQFGKFATSRTRNISPESTNLYLSSVPCSACVRGCVSYGHAVDVRFGGLRCKHLPWPLLAAYDRGSACRTHDMHTCVAIPSNAHLLIWHICGQTPPLPSSQNARAKTALASRSANLSVRMPSSASDDQKTTQTADGNQLRSA